MSDTMEQVFTVDFLDEITKAEYDRMKALKQQLLVDTSHYFVWSRGKKRIIYLIHEGKYYYGWFADDMNTNELVKSFDYEGVKFTKPYAVFTRKVRSYARDTVPSP